MPLNESRLAYENEYDIMNRALATPDGLRISYPTKEEAKYYQMRFNYARTLDRRFNNKRYPISHPMHQHSEYDALTFRIKESGKKFWIYAQKRPIAGVVEEITKETEEPKSNNYRRA